MATLLVAQADQYSLDWKLIPAIAGVESNFEKAGNTSDFNAWGFMCGPRPCRFASFREAIEKVAKTLGTGKAYAEFRKTGSIEVLARKYNYASPSDWTTKVNHFMGSIEQSQ